MRCAGVGEDGRGDLARRQARRFAFEQATHRERVQECLHRVGPHDQRPAALALERAFAFQPPHRLAHRRARHAETRRDQPFGHRFARRDGAAQDHVEQRAIGHDRKLLAVARCKIVGD